MTARVQSVLPAHGSFRLVVIAVMLLAGCDQLSPPEVTDEPEPIPPPAAPPPADLTPVVTRTPEQEVDEFLATEPPLRTDEQLQKLAGLEDELARITELDLRGSAVSDIGAAVLPGFVATTRLDLSESHVTTGVTRHVAGMPGLEELFLDNLPIEDEGIAPLPELPALRSLSLSGTPVTENCFLHLAECESLETLILDNNERLLGNGFSELVRQREFAALRELSVNRTGFGYHGIRELHGLPQLERLSAADAEVTDPELDGIRACTGLQSLNLSENRLSDAGLQRLTRLRELQELDVSGCEAISDAGLRHLRGHKQLRRLSLEGTRCSLAGATNLKDRFLQNTTILIADQEL